MPFVDGPQVTPAAGGGGFVDAPKPDNTQALLSKYAKQYGVDEAFAQRIHGREDPANDPKISSSAGARGLMQVMPGTFKQMGVGNDITDPDQNMHAGMKYLSLMLQRYHGDQRLAAAAYNAGPGAVDAAGGRVPNIKETQAYAQATAPSGFVDAPASIPKQTGGFVDSGPPGSNQATRPPQPEQPQNVPTPQAGNAPPAGGGVPHTPQPEPAGLNPLQGLVHGVLMAGADPMGGLNAILGLPQRIVAGTLTGDPGAILTPFDQARQSDLNERTTHIPIVSQVAGGVGAATGMIGKLSDMVTQAVGHPTHNEKFLGNVGKIFAAQAITDPLNLVPFIGEAKMANTARMAWETAAHGMEAVGAKVPGLARATKAAQEYHEGLIKPKMNQIFGTRPELDPFLDTTGKAARLSIEEKNADKMAEEGARQADLAKKYKTEITNAKTFHDLPSEVQQESMREAWRYGTPEMRAKVEQDVYVGKNPKEIKMGTQEIEGPGAQHFGFKPTQEDLEKFPKPLGIVKYDPREHYTTLISPKPPAKYSDMDLFSEYGAKPQQEHAGFEKQARPDQAVHDDMYERTLNRWKLGRNVIRQRMTDADTKAFLLEHGGSRIPATAESVDAITRQLSHSPKKFDIPGYSTTSRNLARAGIQLNPLPHGLKNVGDLQELEGGPIALGKGLAYAAKGLTKEQLDWHHSVGTGMNYTRGAYGPITTLANKIGSQQVLERLEMGYRQALKEHYDQVMGPSKSIADDYMKAQKIRDALGDYRNVNAFTAALQAVGGPFVAFRTSVTPKAVGRALLKAPQRVEGRARASEDINQELHKERTPSSFHYGGPVEDVARMLSKTVDYGKSAATIGPLLSGLANLALGKEGAQKALTTTAESYIPAMQEIMPMLKMIPGAQEWLQKNGLAYHEAAGTTPFNDALNTVFGSHFENPTSAKRRWEIEAQSRGIR